MFWENENLFPFLIFQIDAFLTNFNKMFLNCCLLIEIDSYILFSKVWELYQMLEVGNSLSDKIRQDVTMLLRRIISGSGIRRDRGLTI